MLLHGIDWPSEIIEAIENDNLVVFAGAGVSKSNPAHLPLFNELAKQMVGKEIPANENADVFLGKAQASGIDIQAACREIIGQADTHNSIHSALISLFAQQSAKIATTNFDLLFESAAAEKAMDLQVFHAPALPIGSDFTGIVHLHGSIYKCSNRMVLSDADFGRAYLTEGWARRFVVQLFEKYTVLFVGYSHNDSIMQYLARGLAEFANTKRFALSLPKELESWKHRGIEPIKYESHEILPTAIEKFAKQLSGGKLCIKRRFREILSKENPPLDMDDVSFLEEYLKNGKGVDYFVDYAKPEKYIDWLYDRGLFDAFWQKNNKLNDSELKLANWLFNVPKDNKTFFELCAKKFNYGGIVLNDKVLETLSRWLAYDYSKEMSDTDFSKWISLLISSNGNNVIVRQYIWDIFFENVGKRNDDAIFLLFDFLTTRFLTLQKHWHDENKMMASFTFDIQDGELHYRGETLFEFARRNALKTLNLLIHKIEAMYLHEAAWGNYIIFRIDRNAIEPHKQNHTFGKTEHLLLDMAREALDRLLVTNHALADSMVCILTASSVKILNRLGIYGVWKSTYTCPDKKFSWLIEHGYIDNFDINHEAFETLKSIYSLISVANKQILFDIADETLKANSEKYTLRHVISVVYGLLNFNPACVETKIFYEKLLVRCPDFNKTEYSGMLVTVMQSDSVKYRGKSAKEFLDEMSIEEAVALLNTIDAKNTPSWDNSFYGFSWAVAENFEYSIKVADFIVTKPYECTKIWAHLFFEWAKAKLTKEQTKRVVGFAVAKGVCEQGNGQEIAKFLCEYSQNEDKSELLPVALTWRASLMVWRIALNDKAKNEIGDDLFDTAVKHPAGMLISFWLDILNRATKAKEKRSIPAVFRRRFEDVLQAEGLSGQCARAILGTNLKFLFWFDRAWFEQAILLFLCDDKNIKSLDVWNGFFQNATWGDDLLLCIHEPLQGAIVKVLNEGEKAYRDLDYLFADILLDSQYDKNIELVDIFLTNAEVEDIYRFLFAVWSSFKDNKEINTDIIWRNRLRPLVEKIKIGKIKSFDKRSLFMFGKIALYLNETFPNAVQILCGLKCSGTNNENNGFFYDLEKQNITRHHGEYLKLIAYLLPDDVGDSSMFGHCDRIIKITESLFLVAKDTDSLRVVCEKLVRCGNVEIISKYLEE